jgi:hypothetical protein
VTRIAIQSVGVCCASGLGDERVIDPRAPAAFSAPSLSRFSQRRVGRAAELDPEACVAQKKSLKLMSRAALLGVAAARQLALPDRDVAHAGLFLGVGMSGGEIAQLAGLLDASLGSDGAIDLAAMGRDGLARLNPLLSFQVLNNMPLCHVSIELGLGGPHGAIWAPGAEALHAFDRAAEALSDGKAPWAVAGGADAPVNTVSLALADPNTNLAEAAALAVLVPVEKLDAGAIEWRGLDPKGDADLWISVGESGQALVPRGARAIALSTLFGETLAASGALAVALAVRELRVDRSIATVAICARDESGPLCARIGRAS